MWRWSFSGVRELRDNVKPLFAFKQWNKGKTWNKKLKKHLTDWARCDKAIGGICFTKKWRAVTLQPGLEFDNFKSRLKSCIFKCIFRLNGSFFGGWWSGFSERGSQDLSNGTKCRLSTRQFFFSCLHIHSLWFILFLNRRCELLFAQKSTKHGSNLNHRLPNFEPSRPWYE
jgi:hypothetical protein